MPRLKHTKKAYLFQTGSHYVPQAGLGLTAILPLHDDFAAVYHHNDFSNENVFKFRDTCGLSCLPSYDLAVCKAVWNAIKMSCTRLEKGAGEVRYDVAKSISKRGEKIRQNQVWVLANQGKVLGLCFCFIYLFI